MPSKTPASAIALGGMLGALGVVILCLGTLIPVGTYACPVLCMLLLRVVLTLCGRRMAWAWYGAEAILALLLAPDKEAAAVFVVIGYYPMVKPGLDRKKLPWLWKALLFNGSVLVLYWLLMNLLGMEQILQEFSQLGLFLTAVLLGMGNLVFFLLDRLLDRKIKL